MENNSEVTQLLENIRLSYESAHLALHGPAIVGRHEFISKKLENMQQSHAQLQTIVGEHEAIKLVAETLDTVGGVQNEEKSTVSLGTNEATQPTYSSCEREKGDSTRPICPIETNG